MHLVLWRWFVPTYLCLYLTQFYLKCYPWVFGLLSDCFPVSMWRFGKIKEPCHSCLYLENISCFQPKRFRVLFFKPDSSFRTLNMWFTLQRFYLHTTNGKFIYYVKLHAAKLFISSCRVNKTKLRSCWMFDLRKITSLASLFSFVKWKDWARYDSKILSQFLSLLALASIKHY